MPNMHSHQIAITFTADVHNFGEVYSANWIAEVQKAVRQATRQIENRTISGQIQGRDGKTIGAFLIDEIKF